MNIICPLLFQTRIQVEITEEIDEYTYKIKFNNDIHWGSLLSSDIMLFEAKKWIIFLHIPGGIKG